MMKNKSTLAKLLSEEDVNVVHKQMDTAYFDAKKRELGLPIWKDEEMTKDIYDLMVCHEIGHALWTPLDMLEKAALRKINHTFVNILEDARIERFVKNKYPGSVGVFNRGYNDLTSKNFFGIDDNDVNDLNLIDKINVFFKGNSDVTFSKEEKVWADRASKTKTPAEVLDLAEELYKYMKENSPETESKENLIDMPGMTTPSESGESDEGDSTEGESGEGKSDEGDSTEGKSDEGDEGSTDSKKGKSDNDDSDDGSASGSSTDDGEKTDDDSDTDKGKESSIEGGEGESGEGNVPKATTDSAFGKAMDELRDKDAGDRHYANIPKIDMDKHIVDYKTCIEEFYGKYAENSKDRYFSETLEKLEELKNDSKKTVAYMVKEFEMKKAADQYARAAVSKTGSLNMDKLHTYKYNEDLFKKVTTLPGATNHGMVMVLDWSGSMGENLAGTCAQLFNLIWFCRKVKIPFEVFAFSDIYPRKNEDSVFNKIKSQTKFKCGDIALRPFSLLNFFSSNMTIKEEMEMMHSLWMYANRFNRRNYYYDAYPLIPHKAYSLGGTPLNESIIAMMDIVPKFKSDTGVQKVNTVFLTDGASNGLKGVYNYKLITEGDDKGKHKEFIDTEPIANSWGLPDYDFIITDPVTNKSYEVDFAKGLTNELIRILKNRVYDMNVVGFFIAGSGRTGRVDKRTIRYLVNEDYDVIMEMVKFLNKNKYLAITQCGYDAYYILPGGNALKTENAGLSDDLIGASKAKLKTAFGKSMKGKIESRQLLNQFVNLVA